MLNSDLEEILGHDIYCQLTVHQINEMERMIKHAIEYKIKLIREDNGKKRLILTAIRLTRLS